MENDKIIEQIKRDYKTTEEWILSYYEKREEFYNESRYIHDCSYSMETGRAGTSSNGYNSFRAIQFSDLEYTEKWLLAVELMLGELSEEKKIFVEQRRRAEQKSRYMRKQKKARVNWVLFVQEHYAREMARKYGDEKGAYWLSEKTIKIWWKEIIDLTRLIAQKKGCICHQCTRYK